MIDSLRVHRFEPGDRLLITSEHLIDQNTADRLKAVAEAWSGVPVLILGEGMGIEVARGLPVMEPGELLENTVTHLSPDTVRGLPPEGEPRV